MTKSIVVSGDLVVDHDLTRLHGRGWDYHSPCPQTLLSRRAGGAWYVEDLLRLVLGDGTPESSPDAPKITAPKRPSFDAPGPTPHEGIASAFSVWQRFDGGKERVWRIGEFLGCQRPVATPHRSATMDADLAEPDLLVVDDLGLGFASHPGWWPAALGDTGAPKSIVVKASAPFDGPLWEKLLAPGTAENVTVVVSAAALRETGANLSRALSWDRTIEDLSREFTRGQSAAVFHAVKRVVVLFGAEGAGVYSRLPRGPQEPALSNTLHFDRFVYDPELLEGSWRARHGGLTFGGPSLLAAAIARHDLQGDDFPLFFAICRALSGMRAIHAAGSGSHDQSLDLHAPDAAIRQVFAFAGAAAVVSMDKKNPDPLPEDRFRAAFPRELLDPVHLHEPQIRDRCLLTDVTGESLEFIAAKAEEIVRDGMEKALAAVPRAKYEKFVTFDREEIERINSIRNLILDYRGGKDARPLSIAVFGQPGSGKSFAIKQLATELFGKTNSSLEFNLSQFESVHDLHEALHQVRDKSLEGFLPLVFWDEFDSPLAGRPLGWLKEFLAPMQDAKFLAGGVPHPIGRAIFVFAGGTRASFEEFAKEPAPQDETDERRDARERAFKEAKAPDFISRLRGYVNIKGPNPVTPDDHAYLVRRALLLRSMLERYFGDSIIDRKTKAMHISPGVLSGLLLVDKYEHGARSMEAVVSLSHLHEAQSFEMADLPPRELLDLHLSSDFLQRASEAELFAGPIKKNFVERLAAEQHRGFCEARTAAGWICGQKRDNKKKIHPLLKPFEELDEAGKEMNREPARLAIARLSVLKYKVLPTAFAPAGAVRSLAKDELQLLAVSEHQRWMRERLVAGFQWSEQTSDSLRLHRDLQPFELLTPEEQRLDDDPIAAIIRVLQEMGLVLVKSESRA